LAIDPSSNLYLADVDAGAVCCVDSAGSVATFSPAVDFAGGVVYSAGNLNVTKATSDASGNTKPGGIYKIDGGGNSRISPPASVIRSA
jgi:hypothetical protein